VTAHGSPGSTGVGAEPAGVPGPDDTVAAADELPGVPGPDASVASLVRMANQIASNSAHKPHDIAVGWVADHLREFWAPSMRQRLVEWVDTGGTGLDAVARDAVELLRSS
jgi:formate dehydrogenase subunit delta